MSERFLAPTLHAPEEELDRSLRPQSLADFVGQERVKEQLAVALDAAKARGEALDHVLLAGPPGLGKTSLAQIVRRELGVGIRQIAGPGARAQGRHRRDPHRARAARRALRRRDPPAQPRGRGDPLPGARGLPARHRRRPGAGRAHAHARPAAVHARRRDHAHRPADDAAARPLRRSRSGSTSTRTTSSRSIVRRSARILGVEIEGDAADEIARRARGTPRIANRILRRVRDVAEVRHAGAITTAIAEEALELLEVDEAGLERFDRELLRAVVEKFGGGPVGLSTLAVALGEEAETIEDVYEPYLLQLGFLQRTPRGPDRDRARPRARRRGSRGVDALLTARCAARPTGRGVFGGCPSGG